MKAELRTIAKDYILIHEKTSNWLSLEENTK